MKFKTSSELRELLNDSDNYEKYRQYANENILPLTEAYEMEVQWRNCNVAVTPSRYEELLKAEQEQRELL